VQPSARGIQVYASPFVTVEVYYALGVVVLRRTAEPFARADQIDAVTSALASAVPVSGRARQRILVDMREAPTRPPPELEAAFTRFRSEIERGFARVVLVVASVVGRARAQRLPSTAAESRLCFSIDEAWRVALER
jgi:hypothetical protein